MADRIVTIASSGGDYTTLPLALAGESDFQAGEDNIIFRFASAVAGTSSVILTSGYTTAAAHRIRIEVPAAYRHSRTRDSGARITGDFGWASCLHVGLNYVTVDGLALYNSSTGDPRGIRVLSATGIIISNCLVYDIAGRGIDINQSDAIVVNCMAYNNTQGFRTANGAGYTVNYYNCTALNNGHGIYIEQGTNNLKNCYSGGSVAADYYMEGAATVNYTTCHSADGTGTTTITALSNCDFESYTAGSENADIGADSDLFGAGSDLRSDSAYNVTTDIADNTRATTPCVGAFEYIASGGASIGPLVGASALVGGSVLCGQGNLIN